MQFDIKHLKVFVAVAEELNFHRAAERLAIAQPAVSRTISELEQRLNVKLLERTTRMVRLTGPGRYLLQESHELLKRMSNVDNNLRHLASGNKAILQIGYTTINCHELVPDVLAHFARTTPEIRVQLHYLSAPAQRDKIITGELDGGFVEGSFHSSEIATALVGRHRLMVLMGREHALSAKATLSVDEIVDEEIILGTNQDWPTLRQIVLDTFQAAGRILTIRHEPPTLTAILGLVASGAGITLFPGMPLYCRGGPLVARAIVASPAPIVESHFVWRRFNTSTAIQRLRDSAKAVAARQQKLPIEEAHPKTEP